MPRVRGAASPSAPPRHLASVDDNDTSITAPLPPVLVARFAGYLLGHSANAKGEWSLRFGAEASQTNNIMGLFEHLGGTMFEIKVQIVSRSELPGHERESESESDDEVIV